MNFEIIKYSMIPAKIKILKNINRLALKGYQNNCTLKINLDLLLPPFTADTTNADGFHIHPLKVPRLHTEYANRLFCYAERSFENPMDST